MLLRESERSLCQDYQTVFIYSTIACCLGDQCNPSAFPPFPGFLFPFSPPLSDWRLYWLVPLNWPSDGHSSCQEMEINLRQSALKSIDFSWLRNIWKDRPVQPLLHRAYTNNLMFSGSLKMDVALLEALLCLNLHIVLKYISWECNYFRGATLSHQWVCFSLSWSCQNVIFSRETVVDFPAGLVPCDLWCYGN